MIMYSVSVCGFNTQPPEGGWAPDLSFSFTR